MKNLQTIVLVAATCLADGSRAGGLSDLAGTWRTARHGALVKMDDCGDGTPCGRLAWVDARLAEGRTLDVRNRDPGLRRRELIGVPILWGFSPQAEGWYDGRLYNPDDGKTFRAGLQRLSADELRVIGCLGPLCRSEIWIRDPKPPAPHDREGRLQ